MKIDTKGLLSVFSRCTAGKNLRIGTTLQTSVLPDKKLDGFLNLPVNFGLRFVYSD